MRIVALLFGSFLTLGVVLDAFQTIILPRRPTGRFRITRLFYIATWTPWCWFAERVANRKIREQIYSIYGPVSLLLLLALWASLLVTGFALFYFAMGSPFADALNLHGRALSNFGTDLYVSGTTLFTLGLGDVTPTRHLVRAIVVAESGTGLGFVALVIGYVPVIYTAFSHREVSVAMLDGRAGSPPSATELLRRHAYEGGESELIALLAEWERWSAEILESHISYPLLCYYRSQHDNQSWLSALVAILDTCALLITTVEGPAARQAQLTFAMARHALIDLGHVFHVEKSAKEKEAVGLDRLPPTAFSNLCENLTGLHLQLCGDPASMKRLTAIRMLYEPHAHALSDYMKMPLPQWVAEPKKTDPWKTVAALRRDGDILRATEHVSDRSAAAHLHDEEHGF
jgi:voltage-gated potassium channel Kch